MQLKAASRLTALEQQVLEAKLDLTKDAQLKGLQSALKAKGILFTMSVNHLYHKSNHQDITKEAEETAVALNSLGYALRIKPGVYGQPSFALKGKSGLTLQKVQQGIRIFYSIKD